MVFLGKRSAESAEFQASRCCICRLVPGTHVKSWSPLNYTGVHQGRDQTTFEIFSRERLSEGFF